MGIGSLAKDTAVYGLSSIEERFLNWCLVPLYAYLFAPAQYGIVSYLYSFTAVMLIILNYGMETGFFRFASRSEAPERVYTTSLISVGATSLLFILIISLFASPISSAIKLSGKEWYVWMLGVTVAIDAFTNLPFAYLRYRKKAWTFAGIKFLNIGLNIGLNLFFLLACPKIADSPAGEVINWFYAPLGGKTFGIGWIFLANLLSTLVILLSLLPWVARRRFCFDKCLWRKMLGYSWPLLILGVAGIMSQNMGQMVIPYIFAGNEEAARQMVGIYGANIKIAIVMVMFTQAFRYAYEPFIFAQAKGEGGDNRRAYADATKYFVIFGLLIFLGVMYFLPVLKYFISPAYWGGLRIVPIMMMAELFAGVFFNLSVWYKLTDRTRWGMYLSLICFAVMLGLNLWLVPMIGIPDGYVGSAWAALAAYFVVMALSWAIGRKYYPIDYPIGKMGGWLLLTMVLWSADLLHGMMPLWAEYSIKALILLLYVALIGVTENVPLLRLRRRSGRHKKS